MTEPAASPREAKAGVAVDDRAAVVAIEPDGTVAFAEGDALEALGLDGAMRAGARFAPGARVAPALVPLVAAARTGSSADRVLVSGDGRAFTVRCRPRRGRPGAVMLYFAEETPRLSAERELRLVFSQVPGAIWTTDRDLRVTDGFGRLLGDAQGLSRDEVVGRHIGELVRAEGPNHPAIARHQQALAGVAAAYALTFEGRTYDVHVEPLLADDGAVMGTVGIALDITEQREVERALRESEARLAEAQRLAHIGSWEWEVAADRLWWNDEVHRIFGLGEGAFRGGYEAFLNLVHPEDRELVRRSVFSSFREGRPFEYEHRLTWPDGSVRMIHCRGDVVKDAAGKVVRMLGCCWDITPLWEATRARERTVSLLHATLEATADGLLVVDREGRITASNERFRELWRIPEEMFRRGDDAELLAYVGEQLEKPGMFRARVRELYEDVEAESRDVLRFKDGRVFERYSRPQRLGNECIGRVWSFRDITARAKLLARAYFLVDASRLLVTLEIDRALDAVAHLAVPALAAACAVDLFGNGEPRRHLVVSGDSRLPMMPLLPPAVLSGHVAVFEEDGASFLSVPVEAHGRRLGALTFRAVENRAFEDDDVLLAEELARRAALAIENSRLWRRMEAALRERDEFLSIAAHEIRGPLTAIHLASQSLRQGRLPPQMAERMHEAIEREDRRLSRFVDELLVFGRIRTGQLRFQMGPVDLAAVVRDAVARLAPEIARSGSAMRVDTGAPVVGYWDATQLTTVVTNLVSNALKFGLGRPVEVQVSGDGQRARLVVRDHGAGVPPEIGEQVFEPFRRGVSARHYGGLGLGLFIVKTIVDGLGGSVRVASEPGEGATFTVELPQERRS